MSSKPTDNAKTSDKGKETNGGTKIPPLMWAFAAVLALGTGVGGYIVGDNHGYDRAAEEFAAGKLPAQESSAPVTEIPEDAAPGTDFTQSEGGEDAAMIHGPGSPINSRQEISNSARRDATDPFAVGAVDAPVVIAEFTDWECPFCIRHAAETEPDLLKEYVDTGYIRIEWNDMPINGEASLSAARAGRAAAEQGKFAEYKKAYFEKAHEAGGHPGFGIEDFVGFAETAGVPDLDKFQEDATSDKYDKAIEEALDYAQGLGISGTPGFIVNDEFIGGALPIDDFRKVINGELQKTTKS